MDLTLTPPVGMVLNHVDGSGNQVDITELHLDNTAAGDVDDTRIAGNGGTLVVGVGGRFQIDAAQANGGDEADFLLTAEYP